MFNKTTFFKQRNVHFASIYLQGFVNLCKIVTSQSYHHDSHWIRMCDNPVFVLLHVIYSYATTCNTVGTQMLIPSSS